MTASARTEVLVFDFPQQRGRLEGLLEGALERAESGGAVRVLEVIFVGRDPDGDGIRALRLEGGSGGLVTALSDFRLGRAQEGTAEVPDGADALAAEIAPGEAIVAVLVEHRWAAALDDAVTRSGGHALICDSAPAGTKPDLAVSALSAVRAATAA